MDMKYAVLLMTDYNTFLGRFELALQAHGESFTRETIVGEDYIADEMKMIEKEFIAGANRHEMVVKLYRVPFPSGICTDSYYLAVDNSGDVVGLYKVSKDRCGVGEYMNTIVALTVVRHMRSYHEMHPEQNNTQ